MDTQIERWWWGQNCGTTMGHSLKFRLSEVCGHIWAPQNNMLVTICDLSAPLIAIAAPWLSPRNFSKAAKFFIHTISRRLDINFSQLFKSVDPHTDFCRLFIIIIKGLNSRGIKGRVGHNLEFLEVTWLKERHVIMQFVSLWFWWTPSQKVGEKFCSSTLSLPNFLLFTQIKGPKNRNMNAPLNMACLPACPRNPSCSTWEIHHNHYYPRHG